jgi:putative cardiolipin synthase
LFKVDDKAEIDKARASMKHEMSVAGDSIYADAISTPVLEQLSELKLKPYIAPARLITDDPQKLLGEVTQKQQIVANEMREELLKAESEIVIVTPYFIPRERGIELIRKLRAKGVRITILTNSLATNNHTSVHSAYSGYRKRLLDAGVELWEARADAAKITTPDGETQLDKLTLHTKGVLIDNKKLFVGSLNLDPRSIDINTEMGLLINSREMGERVNEEIRKRIENIAYRVKMDDEGHLSWHATIDGREVVETKEPQTSAWDRFKAWFLKIAPERQL